MQPRRAQPRWRFLSDDPPNDTVLVGVCGSDQFGYSVTGVSDLDGDLVDEILIGAWQADSDSSSTCSTGRFGDEGSATLYMPGLSGDPALIILGEAFRDHLGRAVAAGDVFGTTGRSEIILSGLAWNDVAPGSPTEIGKGYVWDGDTVLLLP
jgi:hypothetical protein